MTTETQPLSAADRYVTFDVTQGVWDIRKEGHCRATAHADSEGLALRRARILVADDGGGCVRVLNRTGKVVSTAIVTPAPGE